MEKNELLQSLKRVKLVIGNGFDCACGLKSTYHDFFNWCKETNINSKIQAWIKKVTDLIPYAETLDHLVNDPNTVLGDLADLSVWNLYFVTMVPPDSESNSYWYQIEETIADSLQELIINGLRYPRVDWPAVRSLFSLQTSIYSGQDERMFVLAAFLVQKYRGIISGVPQVFYSILLRELKIFEKQFVQFLRDQLFLSSPNDKTQISAHYQNRAMCLVRRLTNLANISSIDTFNYTSMVSIETERYLNHVNGDLNHPIFGIDSNSFQPDDARVIFTKTNRRMEWDMTSYVYQEDPGFENVVVFGHSLSSGDYSYFFPLLDRLNITDFTASGMFVLVYSIYDSGKAETIKEENRLALHNLFFAYAKYKGISEPARLLDGLTTRKRVLLYQMSLPALEE